MIGICELTLKRRRHKTLDTILRYRYRALEKLRIVSIFCTCSCPTESSRQKTCGHTCSRSRHQHPERRCNPKDSNDNYRVTTKINKRQEATSRQSIPLRQHTVSESKAECG